MSTTDLFSCLKHSILPSGRQFLDPSGIPQVSEGQNICKKNQIPTKTKGWNLIFMELQNMYVILNMFYPVITLFIHSYIFYIHLFMLRVTGRLLDIPAQTEQGRGTHSCKFTPVGNLQPSVHPTCIFVNGRKLEETHTNTTN